MTMRKFFTLCMFILGGMLIGANAQTVDENYQFTDSEGNIIPDGTTLTFTDVETIEDAFGGPSSYLINSGLYLINAGGTPGAYSIVCTVNSIHNGVFQVCAAGNCTSIDKAETRETNRAAGPASLNEDLRSEFVADNNTDAYCDVTYQVYRHTAMSGGESYPGSTIHVLFTTDTAAGIGNVSTGKADSKIVARYTLDGAQLQAPLKGINIVKYADGRTEKVVVR